jgi:hypothetical protein
MLKAFLLAGPLAVVSLLVSTAGQAQPVEHPIGHAGALVSYSDADVTLRDKEGKDVVVAMTPGWTVVTARKVAPDTIKAGDFVATINTDLGPEAGRATELRLFEPGYRPELGTHAMPQPATSITHGTVILVRKAKAGLELEVGYPGGTRRIEVPAAIAPIGYEVHDRLFAQPGMQATAVTRRDTDGVWRAGRIMLQP